MRVFPVLSASRLSSVSAGSLVAYGDNLKGIVMALPLFKGTTQTSTYVFDFSTCELTPPSGMGGGDPCVGIFAGELTLAIDPPGGLSTRLDRLRGGEIAFQTNIEEPLLVPNQKGKPERVAFTFRGERVDLYESHVVFASRWKLTLRSVDGEVCTIYEHDALT